MKVTLRSLLLWPGLMAMLGAAALPAETNSIENLEKAAADWVKVRAESTRLQVEWSSQHQLLESMVNGLNERAQSLETNWDYLQAKTAKERDDISRLETANQSAAAGLAATEAQLKAIDAKLVQLRPALPPRLSAALELPFKSLAAADLTVGERMQLTLTVLNRCAQFNRAVASDEELLNPDGEKDARLLEVIYWGLSHGYALDRARGLAWFGSPGPAGWRWEPAPDAAKRVAEVIAISRGKSEPLFVEVPARLGRPATGTAKASQP